MRNSMAIRRPRLMVGQVQSCREAGGHAALSSGRTVATAAGDARADALGAARPAVLVVVVGPVGVQLVGSPAWPATPAAHRWNLVDQRQELRDVVAVATGQRHSQRDAGALGQDVVLGA